MGYLAHVFVRLKCFRKHCFIKTQECRFEKCRQWRAARTTTELVVSRDVRFVHVILWKARNWACTERKGIWRDPCRPAHPNSADSDPRTERPLFPQRSTAKSMLEIGSALKEPKRRTAPRSSRFQLTSLLIKTLASLVRVKSTVVDTTTLSLNWTP